MKTLRLDELEGLSVLGTLRWKPVRKTLGVTAFGINAYTAENAGDEVVEEHDETQLGHEEVYAVVSGHAVFTVDGEEVDAPAGTLVFLDDPAQKRAAHAREAGTTVLAIGGVPGRHEISAWEYYFPAYPYAREGDYDRAIATIEEGLAEMPGHPSMLYHLAAIEAQAGRSDDAIAHLAEAVEKSPRLLRFAREDDDFAAIRDDPRFPA